MDKEEKLWQTIYFAGERKESHLEKHLIDHLHSPWEKIRIQALSSLCLIGSEKALLVARRRIQDKSLSNRERKSALLALRKHPETNKKDYRKIGESLL